jgi:hypothetical protein
MLEHASHRVGDAVDLREEGLGDDEHPEAVRRGSRERNDVGGGGAAETPPLQQVHGPDARKQAATVRGADADDT